MRSATASRAVSISTGTRLPAPRSRRHTSRPSMSGSPMSSTTASGSLARHLGKRGLAAPRPARCRTRPARARGAGRRAGRGRRRRSGCASGPLWLAAEAFFGDSYAVLTLLLHTGGSLLGMRRQRSTTIIVVGGALAIASVGYGLGTQAGDGTAIADNDRDRAGRKRRGAGRRAAVPFERGAPPGLQPRWRTSSAWADRARRRRCATTTTSTRQPPRRVRGEAREGARHLDREGEQRVRRAPCQKHEARFAARLAERARRGHREGAGRARQAAGRRARTRRATSHRALADELGLDASDVRAR